MKEDKATIQVDLSSNLELEAQPNKTSTKVSPETRAEAYKLKRWRNQATPIRGVE